MRELIRHVTSFLTSAYAQRVIMTGFQMLTIFMFISTICLVATTDVCPCESPDLCQQIRQEREFEVGCFCVSTFNNINQNLSKRSEARLKLRQSYVQHTDVETYALQLYTCHFYLFIVITV